MSAALAASPVGEPMLAIRGVKTFYGKIIRPQGRRPRRPSRRDRHADRRQRRRQVDPDDDGCSAAARPRRRDPVRGAEHRRPADPRDRPLKIAQSPEGRRVFPRMTVYENLQMGASLGNPADFDHVLERIFTLFPRLKERVHQRGGTLSGGEQQMLAIGRGLDEPAEAPAARRALARPRAAHREADLRCDPHPERDRRPQPSSLASRTPITP